MSSASPAAPNGPLPYGPQTLEIRRFLQRLAALPQGEWTAAADEYEALQGTGRFAAADRALSAAVARTQREPERDAALGPLAQLLRMPGAPGAPPADDDPLAPVAEAALAATLALLVRDVLPATAFATLYAPFATRIPLDALTGAAGPTGTGAGGPTAQ
ncbi:hypothetical protein [Roseisolibacter agri]|uniref:Uncharacterized protein n=1 Tax=Roseisolibacter agri TaxID=2014610 RepID=A0AA37Q7I6_9BACT|nr:hypothetical protein [Roseisolibacter agri]GLC27684.1 hypothetical protein rosag_41970 [Roseisolibacter agri]